MMVVLVIGRQHCNYAVDMEYLINMKTQEFSLYTFILETCYNCLARAHEMDFWEFDSLNSGAGDSLDEAYNFKRFAGYYIYMSKRTKDRNKREA